VICSITSSGLAIPPAQNAFQTASILLRMSPVIMVGPHGATWIVSGSLRFAAGEISRFREPLAAAGKADADGRGCGRGRRRAFRTPACPVAAAAWALRNRAFFFEGHREGFPESRTGTGCARHSLLDGCIHARTRRACLAESRTGRPWPPQAAPGISQRDVSVWKCRIDTMPTLVAGCVVRMGNGVLRPCGGPH
jgi:hypothetical protein